VDLERVGDIWDWGAVKAKRVSIATVLAFISPPKEEGNKQREGQHSEKQP
jgi:hypothetical protein